MFQDPAFVRACQSLVCGGRQPFETGERACRVCGSARVKRCWSMEMLGGASDREREVVADALDADLHSACFLGRVVGRLVHIEGQHWAVERADLEMIFGSRIASARSDVESALKAAGITVTQRAGHWIQTRPVLAPLPAPAMPGRLDRF